MVDEAHLLLIDLVAIAVLDNAVPLNVLITVVCIFYSQISKLQLLEISLLSYCIGSLIMQLWLLDYLLQHHGKISRFGEDLRSLSIIFAS